MHPANSLHNSANIEYSFFNAEWKKYLYISIYILSPDFQLAVQ